MDTMNPTNGATGAPNMVMQSGDGAGAVTLAGQLADAVRDLVNQLQAQEQRRSELERHLADLQGHIAQQEQRRQEFGRKVTESLSEDDLRNLQQILQRLSEDPNHILVLAAVAQHVGPLLQVVNTYHDLRASMTSGQP